MQQRNPKNRPLHRSVASIGRFLVAIAIPLIAFFVLYLGFVFLRDSDAPRLLIVVVAILWGVGGVALLYWIFNGLVERLPHQWTARLQPFVFVGPAIAILAWYLALPAYRTGWLSLFDRNGFPDGFSTFLALDVAGRHPKRIVRGPQQLCRGIH